MKQQIITCAFLLSFAQSAKRENIIKIGPTLPPSFRRKEGKESVRCPEGAFAIDKGTICCSQAAASSHPACPTKTYFPPLLDWYDPPECCDPNNISKCEAAAGQLCTAFKYVFPKCPADNPLPIDFGFYCCKYHVRDPACPRYSASIPDRYIVKSDPSECCPADGLIKCTDEKGKPGLCSMDPDLKFEITDKTGWVPEATLGPYVGNHNLYGIHHSTDGIISTFFASEIRSVPYEFIQITLDNDYQIISVYIIYRQEAGISIRFEYYQIRIGHTDSMQTEPKGAQLQANPVCGEILGPGPHPESRHLFECGSPGMIGNIVTVQRVAQTPGVENYLDLNEIMIYEMYHNYDQ